MHPKCIGTTCALLVLNLFLPLCFAQQGPDGILAEYRSIPKNEIDRKLAVLEKLGEFQTDAVDRFVYLVMDREDDDRLRVKALRIWADRNPPETIIEYLDSKTNYSAFESFIPAIPLIDKIDGFRFLKKLYTKPGAIKFRPSICRAITAKDESKALRFLKKRWTGCDTSEEAKALLPALLSMSELLDPEFYRELMMSTHPMARIEGAKHLLISYGDEVLEEIDRSLDTEELSEVRAAVLNAMADIGTDKSVQTLLERCATHPGDFPFEIVEALARVPIEVLRRSIPKEWFYFEDPLRFQVVSLAFTSATASSDALTKEELKILKRGCRHTRPAVRLISSIALVRVEDRQGGAMQRIRSILCSGDLDEQWEVLDEVQRFRLRDPVVIESLLKIMQGNNWKIQIKAAEVLGVLGIAEAIDPFAKALKRPKTLLRVAVVKALARIDREQSVSLLIGQLYKEEGRVAWEIARSLTRLTGMNFGIDAERWDAVWGKTIQDKIALPPQSRIWSYGDRRDDRYGFFGIPVDSHHILFVLDISYSMRGQKREKMETELTGILNRLTGEHMANIIFFCGSIKKWKKHLVPMGSTRSRYGVQLNPTDFEIPPCGPSTNLYDALCEALSDEEVDTVYLLSDGEPTVGKVLDTQKILDEVLKKNRLMQIRIHTVAIGGAVVSFMKALAEGTGGTFKYFDIPSRFRFVRHVLPPAVRHAPGNLKTELK